MKVSRVSEMQGLDRKAVEEFGIKEELLMENAGLAVFSVILNEIGLGDRKFAVFCGLGNNGGDGFVVARKIHSMGGDVKVFVLGDASRYTGAAGMNYKIAGGLPLEIRQVDSAEAIKSDVLHCHCIVDAIFGTGLAREVGGLHAEVISLINRSGATVLSVDIPSGVHGDTGEIMGEAVRADYTMAFGLPKLGNVLMPGYELCGELYVTHISFPPSMYEHPGMKIEINRPPVFQPRKPDGHKGSFGDVLFVAGASSYLGAPYFSAMSFLKAGGGYSRLAAPGSITPFMGCGGTEIVLVPQKETASGSIALENKPALLDLAEQVDMVVLGPGLSLDEETSRLVMELTREIRKPLLIDGDGITAISGNPGVLKERKADTVLTPHPGEMGRIVSMGPGDILDDSVNILQGASGDLNAVIVLKGAHTLIGCPDERVYINMTGNSGMATAGSGDVLTGTIAAMFGLGLPFQDAVRKGVYIHGLAGDLAAEEKGEDGITARDILEFLPEAVHLDREGLHEEATSEYYLGMRVI